MSWVPLVLAPLDYIELQHLLFNFPLEFIKVDNKLVSILIEGRSILGLPHTMHL